MIPDLLDQILANTYTTTQALNRLGVLKDLVLVKLFRNSTGISVETKIQQTSGQETPWITSLNQNIYRHFNRKNVYRVFEQLEAEIKKIKPLILRLPFDLPEKELSEIGQTLRQSYGKNFLIEIKIDPGEIAGVALVWNGIYKDYSVKQKITDNRERILSTLKEYIKH